MAGNTDTICVPSFRADWKNNVPIAALCQKYGITRDQLVRLKREWRLKPRHDRRVRPREQQPDPTPEEIAAACKAIRESWDEDTELARRTIGAPDLVRVQIIPAAEIGVDEPRGFDDE